MRFARTGRSSVRVGAGLVREIIMREMVRRDRLEYDVESDSESEDESDDESEAPDDDSDGE